MNNYFFSGKLELQIYMVWRYKMFLSETIKHKTEVLEIFLVPRCMAQTIPLHSIWQLKNKQLRSFICWRPAEYSN